MKDIAIGRATEN